MATLLTHEAESDALISLEERVLRAVQLVNQLRKEKDEIAQGIDAAKAEAQAARSALAEAKAENSKLQEELEALRAERKQVRGRIEKLLGQMDLLAQS
jgi:uncharacterized coiled-coil DUF342 family protein